VRFEVEGPVYFEVEFFDPVTGENKTVLGGLTWGEVEVLRRSTREQHYPMVLNARALAHAYRLAGAGFVHRLQPFRLEAVH
jgi:hypothetical protein